MITTPKNDSLFEFTLSSSSHSAWQATSNCSLEQCRHILTANNTCISSTTPCFDYRTLDNTRYCGPGVLCSLLEPCDNITNTCTSTTSVCAVNSCCSSQAVCLPLSLSNYCITGNCTLYH